MCVFFSWFDFGVVSLSTSSSSSSACGGLSSGASFSIPWVAAWPSLLPPTHLPTSYKVSFCRLHLRLRPTTFSFSRSLLLPSSSAWIALGREPLKKMSPPTHPPTHHPLFIPTHLHSLSLPLLLLSVLLFLLASCCCCCCC